MPKTQYDAYDPNGVSLRINKSIAKEISVTAGMIYSSIWYLTQINESNENKDVQHDDKYWTYRSVRAMHEKEYPFFTERQIEHAVKQLVEKGYILKKGAAGTNVRNNTNLYTIGKVV